MRRNKPKARGRGLAHIALGCCIGSIFTYFIFIVLHLGAALTFSNVPRQSVAVVSKPKPVTSTTLSTTSRDTSTAQPRIAWSIPVGGKTERLALLERVVTKLLSSGVAATDIFVMEDNESRKGLLGTTSASARLAQFTQKYGVHVLQSGIVRNRREKNNEFGLFLARHYHFMLDSLLYDGTSDPTGDFGGAPTHNLVSTPYDFAVLIEDDLELMDDAVTYFTHMTTAMMLDPTIFCVCAHADNAFHGFSSEPNKEESGSYSSSSSSGDTSDVFPYGEKNHKFYIRRGNHFMAPGFMVSRSIYNAVIRPTWLQSNGDVLQREVMHMPNGNWDTYLDARIRELECVYPSVPRIAHRGATGYTVRPDRQDAVFSSLRLSSLPGTIDYRKAALDVVSLNYDAKIQRFMDGTNHHIECSEDLLPLRNQDVVLHVKNAQADGAPGWARALNFFGLIGIGGHFPRVRGIHKGTVIVEYLGNTVLLVADYSPFRSRLKANDGVCQGLSGSYSRQSARQPGEIFVGGAMGESCVETCEKKKKVCDDRLIGLLLDCGDSGVCGETKKEWSKIIDCDSSKRMDVQLTGLMKRAAPGMSKNGKCISTIGRHLSCAGKHDQMKRVCVCRH